jgi:hypothetical protein
LSENRTLIPADARGPQSQATLARGPRSVQGLTRRGGQQPAAAFAAVHGGLQISAIYLELF